MTAPISPSNLAELEQAETYARRWRQICDLLGLDRETDPIHTVFEPSKATSETGLARRKPHQIGEPALGYFGGDEDDEASQYERERSGRLFAERKVQALHTELMRLRARLGVPPVGTELAVPRLKRSAVIDAPVLEVGVEANCHRSGRSAPLGAGPPRRRAFPTLPNGEEE